MSDKPEWSDYTSYVRFIRDIEAWAKLTIDSMQTRIDDLENPWVSVDDRLPEVTDKKNDYCFAALSDRSVFHTKSANIAPNSDEIVHWMPIPQLPTPGGE